MPYKDILAALAVALGVIGYTPYFRDILRGQTRPHFFSWLSWSLSEGTIFAVLILNHAGPAAWLNGSTTLICLTVAFFAWSKGDKKFSVLDWFSLVGSILALILWGITKDAFLAVILLVLSDAVAFSITFRKSYYLPGQETIIMYLFSGIKAFIAILALSTYNPTTYTFQGYLVIANLTFVVMTLARRKQLQN